ncbi:MAG TPA: hypothetical protein VNX88_07900 [Terriglobales bacterium]|jgi:hypothetical protein|nr:hypothetical protein [Terriglobales bacterium]
MTLRSVAKSLLALLLVALSSYVLELRLHRDGLPSRDLIVLSSSLVGLVAGVLVYLLSVRERQRRAYVDCRLRVIAEMNHHIRNALQVITFYSRKGEKQEVGVVEAVERIQWALREVLPRLPDSPAEMHAERFATAESYPRVMGSRRQNRLH